MNRWMLREETYHQLVINHGKQARVKGTPREIDHIVVAKLFNPTGAGSWLLSELDPDEGLAFGLADLGYPELGYISMDELAEFKGLGGLGIEEDIHFHTDKPLSQWATEARRLGYIKA